MKKAEHKYFIEQEKTQLVHQKKGFERLHGVRSKFYVGYSYENILIFNITGRLILTIKDEYQIEVPRYHASLVPLGNTYRIDFVDGSDLVVLNFIEFANPKLREKLNEFIKEPNEIIASREQGKNTQYRSSREELEYSYIPTILPLKPVLAQTVQLMCTFLQDKVDTPLIHETKEQEINELLYTYYSSQKLYEFFYPVVTARCNFKNIVYDNYMKVKSIEDFARIAGCSISTFKRKFQKHFGTNTYEWILEQKANMILRYIQLENISFSEISSMFGFSSSAHFNWFCNRRFGQNPSEIRKQHRESVLKTIS